MALLVSSCDTPADAVPGTVALTVRVNANCVGVADTVDVQLTDVRFATVVAGGEPFTKSIAPMRYEITATSRNGAKSWSETKSILSSQTWECGCP